MEHEYLKREEHEIKKYTIKEFAQLTNTSEVTIRKKIKKQELQATLEPSPYGDQYMIPETELNQATATYDVISLARPITAQALVNQIAERMLEVIDAQNEKVNEEISIIKQELLATNQQLTAIRDILENQEKQKNQRKWLRFWK